MKTIVGLIVIVALMLGTMVGCQTTSSEQVYRDVSVGPMTVSIPDDWQRPEGVDEIVSGIRGSVEPEFLQYFPIDGYGPPAEDFALVLFVIKMSELVELEGMTWEGWEALMEAEYMTKEDFLVSFGADVFGECTQTLTLHHTIHGNEAIEGQFEGRIEDVPSIVNVLMVFPENDLGLIILLGEEASVVGYEDVWDTIRDSVQFQY